MSNRKPHFTCNECGNTVDLPLTLFGAIFEVEPELSDGPVVDKATGQLRARRKYVRAYLCEMCISKALNFKVIQSGL